MADRGRAPGGAAPDPVAGAALRFASELVAWVATPWALWGHSVPLAIAALVVLIGLPTLLTTPGDKANVVVPVPGVVSVALNLLQFAAAVVASWFAWPAWAAAAVAVLVGAATIAQLPRWRWLASAPGRPL